MADTFDRDIHATVSPSMQPAGMGVPVRVLVVEDEVVVRRAVIRQLKDPAFEVLEADDGEVALDILQQGVDVVLADAVMPRVSGMELLRRIREAGIDVEVIMMTAHNDLSLAFEAVQAGAFHFLKKPFTTEELRLHILRASERRRMLARTRILEAELDGSHKTSRLVGASRATREVKEFVARIAPLQATVLITGECGTGKEVVAREIHARSPRAKRPFVAVNCGALTETLIESLLFGSVRGAFSGSEDREGFFEAANGGTIFLDEVGELPKNQQVRLLRVLQERKVTRVGETRERDIDVRVIAATNIDIEGAVADGRLRQDLYFRLKVHVLTMPALRDRREDIQALAYHFIQKHAPTHNPRVTRISPTALRAIESFPWPGNVRELENSLVSALGMVRGDTLDLEALPKDVRAAPLTATPSQNGSPAPATMSSTGGDTSLDYNVAKRAAVTEFERTYFRNLMELSQGNISRAARLAGLDRSNFRRILRRALGTTSYATPLNEQDGDGDGDDETLST
jgi:two-component system, NtrC family, response regulator HydG